jgi:hypothetical protein
MLEFVRRLKSYGVLAGGDGGDVLLAGDVRAAGEGLVAGELAAAGEPFGEGDADAAAAAAALNGVMPEATSCHWPLRRANVSITRYLPLIFCVDLPSGDLIFPLVTVIRKVAAAVSLSITLTFIFDMSHESKVIRPASMSLTSCSLFPRLPSG